MPESTVPGGKPGIPPEVREYLKEWKELAAHMTGVRTLYNMPAVIDPDDGRTGLPPAILPQAFDLISRIKEDVGRLRARAAEEPGRTSDEADRKEQACERFTAAVSHIFSAAVELLGTEHDEIGRKTLGVLPEADQG